MFYDRFYDSFVKVSFVFVYVFGFRIIKIRILIKF